MRDELRPPNPPARRHLISIADLTRDDVELLATARSFGRSLEREVKKLPTLRGRTVVNVFYESSTRTSSSFELAAKRLRGHDVDQGGRLVRRQGRVAQGHGPDARGLRPGRDRPPPPADRRPQLVARVPGARRQRRRRRTSTRRRPCSTSTRSRRSSAGSRACTWRSSATSCTRASRARTSRRSSSSARASRSSRRRPLLPRGIEALKLRKSTDIRAIAAADVVYVLRMQQERMQDGASYVPSLREYTARWGVTPERLRPGQKVMHPGPMNRGVEIDPAVADAPESLIETQVRAGLVVRMAVLYDLLTDGPVAAPALRSTRWPDALDEADSESRHRHPRRPRARPWGGRRRPSTCASTPGRSPRWATTSRRTATGS